MTNSHYDVLGVSNQATPTVIKAAFRALMRDAHPDMAKDNSLEVSAAQITQAYDVLSDARRRQTYDEELASHTGQVDSIDERGAGRRHSHLSSPETSQSAPFADTPTPDRLGAVTLIVTGSMLLTWLGLVCPALIMSIIRSDVPQREMIALLFVLLPLWLISTKTGPTLWQRPAARLTALITFGVAAGTGCIVAASLGLTTGWPWPLIFISMQGYAAGLFACHLIGSALRHRLNRRRSDKWVQATRAEHLAGVEFLFLNDVAPESGIARVTNLLTGEESSVALWGREFRAQQGLIACVRDGGYVAQNFPVSLYNSWVSVQ